MKGLGREENGIRLPDGSGYLATIQVYHDLHCVVRRSASHKKHKAHNQSGTASSLDEQGRLLPWTNRRRIP